MKKARLVAAALSLLCAALLGAQASSGSESPSAGALTLSAMPAVSFPLAYWYAGLPPNFYTLTLGAAVDAEYQFGFLPLLFAKAGITYRRAPLTAGPVLHLLEASAGVGAQFTVAPSITLKPYVAGGYHFGILNMFTTTETAVPGWPGRA